MKYNICKQSYNRREKKIIPEVCFKFASWRRERRAGAAGRSGAGELQVLNEKWMGLCKRK